MQATIYQSSLYLHYYRCDVCPSTLPTRAINLPAKPPSLVLLLLLSLDLSLSYQLCRSYRSGVCAPSSTSPFSPPEREIGMSLGGV